MQSYSTSATFEEEVFTLDAENELRFVVNKTSTVCIELSLGVAEIFGVDLLNKKKYVFPSNARVSVFTWQGCTLTVTGRVESLYIAKETPMVIYVNVHAAIEQMRQKADAKGTKGPTVMVTGPTDVGKSTLCRLLLNYAFRQGRTPVFVDLDVGQSDISMPGTVGGLLIDEPAHPVDGFMQKKPLVYHYGHKSASNIRLYKRLISRLAEVIGNRQRYDNCASKSGVIINTSGWVKSDGYRAVTHAALSFEVDVVLVLGHERLYHELCRDVPSFVKVVYLPRASGATERSTETRIEARENIVREYFYGRSEPLSPYSITLNFSEVRIYNIQSREQVGDRNVSLDLKEEGLCLVPVQPGFHLLNHVLSVTFCESIVNDIITTNLAGFICVTKVDAVRGVMTVLSPHPPPLPNHVLLYSDVKFTQELHAKYNN